ncbi:MAG: hypothetical protein K6F09_03505, partial [Clostridiales bacterium]|nr:hypothetical protein [Clostridiales bacterium]
MYTFTKRISSAILAFILLILGVSGSVMHLTDGVPINAKRNKYSYDNSRLLIGAYGASSSNLKSVEYAADAGIDFFITSTSRAFLDECEKFDIGVITSSYLPTAYGKMNENTKNVWVNLKAEDITRHPAIWGYDMIDEPDAGSFDAISEMVEGFRKAAPDKLPYINLFPMYANNEQLGNDPQISTLKKIFLFNTDFSDEQIDQYKRHVSDYINKIDTDYISTDIYPFGCHTDSKGALHKDTSKAWLRNLDILAEACKKTDRDLWVIIQACGNYGID